MRYIFEKSMSKEGQHFAAIQWARKILGECGYTLKLIQPEIIKNTPWSMVIRFKTDKGNIYLKQMPEKIALEPNVIKVLKEKFNASVPEIIAQNDQHNCFLMKDSGRPLREKMKEAFDVSLFCEAVSQFNSLQISVADQLDVFFKIGVPDWRLDKLSGLYSEAVHDSDLLLSEGFSLDQIDKIRSFEPKIIEWSKTLATYEIPASIIQPDFHDNNLLINDESAQLTWIDLGEVLISHPLFSLFTYLQQIKKHHGLKEGDDEYEKIKNVCFQPYQQMVGSDETFEQAISIAEKLNKVYGIAYQYRFMNICGKDPLIATNQWKMKNIINELMEYCNDKGA